MAKKMSGSHVEDVLQRAQNRIYAHQESPSYVKGKYESAKVHSDSTAKEPISQPVFLQTND